MDGHQGVVGKLEAPQAAQVGEDVRGQKDEAVVGQVESLQGSQGAPAQRRGQVHHRGVVVEGSAQVELLQSLVLDAEGLRVDDCQLIVTQIQGAKAAESGEGVGLHLRNSGFEEIQETQFTILILCTFKTHKVSCK